MVAPGLRTLTTQVNIPGDTYIDDDFAFATRDGLIVEIEKNVAPAGYESLGITAPFTRSRFNFVLQKAVTEDEALPLTRMQRVTGRSPHPAAEARQPTAAFPRKRLFFA